MKKEGKFWNKTEVYSDGDIVNYNCAYYKKINSFKYSGSIGIEPDSEEGKKFWDNFSSSDIGDTTFPEDEQEKTFIKVDSKALLHLRAYQILNSSLEELIEFIENEELGKKVKDHFNNSSTQMLLRSEVKEYLLK